MKKKSPDKSTQGVHLCSLPGLLRLPLGWGAGLGAPSAQPWESLHLWLSEKTQIGGCPQKQRTQRVPHMGQTCISCGWCASRQVSINVCSFICLGNRRSAGPYNVPTT